MSKKKITKMLPKQVGFFILDYSKLKMLQFYHEVIDPNISRSDFGYLEMDTDSGMRFNEGVVKIPLVLVLVPNNFFFSV